MATLFFNLLDEVEFLPECIPLLPELTDTDKELADDAHSRSEHLYFRVSREEMSKHYYDTLTLSYYSVELDRGIIPNLYDLYDMEAHPQEINTTSPEPATPAIPLITAVKGKQESFSAYQ